MLRRRIFSAAMASVMALSSVAVVAQAAETTNQVKTKADLEELVTKTYGDAWRLEELGDTEEYTSASVEAMIKALDAADNILADTDSDEADYTVAYLMVEAAAAKLSVNSWRTVEELKALIEECEAIVNKYPNDILNEDLQDQYYYYDGYSALVDQIEEAKGYVDSTYAPTITEAYDALAAAKKNLKQKDQVTKSEFQAMMKRYQDAYASKYDYDQWRRGDVGYWGDDGKNFPWAWVYAGIADGNSKTQIEEAYSALTAVKGIVKTTDENIVAGYKLAENLVKAYESFTADNVAKSTKAGLAKLISEYHGQLAYDFCATDVVDLVTSINTAITAKDTAAKIETVDYFKTTTTLDFATAINVNDVWDTHNDSKGKLGYAAAQIKVTSKTLKTVYIPVNDAGVWDRDAEGGIVTALKDRKDNQTYQTITVGSYFDLANLVGTIDELTLGAYETGKEDEGYWWFGGYNAVLPVALDIAQDYISSSKEDITNPEVLHPVGTLNDVPVDINLIDQTGVIAKDEPKGYASEYVLAYRYLYYALTDTYGTFSSSTNDDKHSRAEVTKLAADCWELIEKTGDAAIFRASNVELVKIRKYALLWVSASKTDKAYIEYLSPYASEYEFAENETGTYTSTDVYHALETAYKQLKAEYDALAISFDEIYDKIADTAAAIDDGELEATDALLKALNDVAYALSEVDYVTYTIATEGGEAVDKEYLDNPAFDSERVFMNFNRLITNDWSSKKGTYIKEIEGYLSHKNNDTHAALYKAYNALNDAIKAQAEPEYVLGDADGDGTVKASDASAILKSIVGLAEINDKAADFNGDGHVNAADAAAILKSLVE